MLMNMNRLNGLIATYKDNASTEAEMLTSYRMACQMIEKEIGCKRWISANLIDFIHDGKVHFNATKIETIQKLNGGEMVMSAFATAVFALGLRLYIKEMHDGAYLIKM